MTLSEDDGYETPAKQVLRISKKKKGGCEGNKACKKCSGGSCKCGGKKPILKKKGTVEGFTKPSKVKIRGDKKVELVSDPTRTKMETTTQMMGQPTTSLDKLMNLFQTQGQQVLSGNKAQPNTKAYGDDILGSKYAPFDPNVPNKVIRTGREITLDPYDYNVNQIGVALPADVFEHRLDPRSFKSYRMGQDTLDTIRREQGERAFEIAKQLLEQKTLVDMKRKTDLDPEWLDPKLGDYFKEDKASSLSELWDLGTLPPSPSPSSLSELLEQKTPSPSPPSPPSSLSELWNLGSTSSGTPVSIPDFEDLRWGTFPGTEISPGTTPSSIRTSPATLFNLPIEEELRTPESIDTAWSVPGLRDLDALFSDSNVGETELNIDPQTAMALQEQQGEDKDPLEEEGVGGGTIEGLNDIPRDSATFEKGVATFKGIKLTQENRERFREQGEREGWFEQGWDDSKKDRYLNGLSISPFLEPVANGMGIYRCNLCGLDFPVNVSGEKTKAPTGQINYHFRGGLTGEGAYKRDSGVNKDMLIRNYINKTRDEEGAKKLWKKPIKQVAENETVQRAWELNHIIPEPGEEKGGDRFLPFVSVRKPGQPKAKTSIRGKPPRQPVGAGSNGYITTPSEVNPSYFNS